MFKLKSYWMFFLVFISLITVNQVKCCSIFTVSSPDGEFVFFGNNKDHRLKYAENTAIWFKPASEESFGAGYLGWGPMDDYEWEGCTWDELPMGGINTAGLCFDMNGVPATEVNINDSKPDWPSKCYTVYALEHCQTVEEVIELYKSYKFPDVSPSHLQLHYADNSGEAVIISFNPNGTLAFTMKENQSFLVSTNFNIVNPNAGGFPCTRYDIAVAMLEEIEKNDNFTIEAIRNILDAIHVEEVSMEDSSSIHTLYTNIFDLKKKDIYIYYLHDYSQVFKFNLETELEKGNNTYLLVDLFKSTSTTNITLEIVLTPFLCYASLLVIIRLKKKYERKGKTV